MPVGDMLRRMTAREYREWQSYYELEAFGPSVQEQQLATLSWIFAEAFSDPKKGGKKLHPQDFMITQQVSQSKEQTWEQQLEIVKMIATATGTKGYLTQTKQIRE